MRRILLLSALVPLMGLVQIARCGEPTSPDPKEIQAVLDKALTFLKNQQDADGSFSPKIAGPGITALVVAGLARNGVSPKEPVMARALAYLETQIQKDGGVYSKGLANYTTSVAIMAFKEVNANGRYDSVIKKARDFVKGLQTEADDKDAKHGGFGYDGKKRPDLSNTGFAVEALLAAGLSKDDPAVQRALKFISRCQNLGGEFNDQPFAQKASKDDEGGFVYHPFDVEKSTHKTADGGLRSLGGMTYGGLKSFLYAGVSKEDPRVKAAVNWVRRHYTLDENPGMGKAGLYYYYHTFGKAMEAWGEENFATMNSAGKLDGKKHPWRQELFEAVKKRQGEEGGWRNQADKTFAEDNPDLATAFAILSLSYCKASRK